MRRTINLFSILSVLILLLLPLTVYSADFGIAPAFKTVDFTPNLQNNLNIRIYNHLNSSVNFSVSCSGTFCNYTTFNHSLLSSPNSASIFNFKIIFPEVMNEQSSKLKFYFTPNQNNNNMISGLLSLGFELTIYNKLFNQDFNYSFYTKDNMVNLVVGNLKNNDVGVHYSIDIYDAYSNLSVFSLSKSAVIQPNSQIIISKPLEQGTYKVRINLTSENTSFTISRDIILGEPIVKIKDYSIEKGAGLINALSLKLLLSWNKPLKAYSELFLYNNTNSGLINYFKGELFDLSPDEIVKSKTFFEIPGEGNYKVRAIVHYENLSVEKNITFRIKKTDKGYEVVFLNQIFGFALLIILVIINIILLLRFLKSRSKVPDKVDQAIKEAELSLLHNNLLGAKRSYYKIELLYKQLPEDKKRMYHERIITIYNRIANYKEQH